MRYFLQFFVFLIIVSIALCCENKESSKRTQMRVVQTKNEESKIQICQDCPECYSKSDLDRLDSTSFHPAMRTISEMEEVRDYSNQNPDQILYCMFETDSDDVYESNSYHIRVMLETETHYSTRFNFYVNKQTYVIKILDVVDDTLVSIEDWRKQKQNPLK